MYSGITISRRSGRIVGVHQKIDRIARANLGLLLKNSHDFPAIKSILRFEGKNGPDGLKIKKSSKDIPWHFINPTDAGDKSLIEIIHDHMYNLSKALKDKNDVRASFEASWLAHAVTDGLTPAHLNPVDDRIEELFGNSPRDMGYADKKRFIKGHNRRDSLAKNWEYWGAGGVIMNHFKYELGVATAIASDKFKPSSPSGADIEYLKSKGFEASFLNSIRQIATMKSYEKFINYGMTMDVATEIRKSIIPEIIKCVTLAWYQAYLDSKSELFK